MMITALAFTDRDDKPIAATRAIAKRLGEPVLLVHALAPLSRASDAAADRRAQAVDRLLAIAEDLRRGGIDVQPELLDGDIVGAIHDCASRVRPSMVIIGGRDGEPYQGTNHVADRLSRRLPCPFLVTGRGGALVDGSPATQRLRAFVALDRTPASDAAIAQLRELRALMPLDVDVASFYWPPDEQARLDLPRSMNLEPDPVAEGLIAGELRQRIGELPGEGRLTVKVIPLLGTIGLQIPLEAKKHGADFVLVGSHQRSAFGGILHGSATQQLLRDCETPVLFAPLAARGPRGKVSEPRRILVATDLSDFGNRAIAYAYEYFRNDGGSVELMHVLSSDSATRLRATMDRSQRFLSQPTDLATTMLQGLAPECADTYDISSQVRVEAGEDVARHIVDRATAIHADAICMASHGSGWVAGALGGSVVHEVLRLADRPVLLVR
ncbi:MAG: universal stress protein [Myxococcota bacterium]|nr:universal stress protein [Myxococcota bacterium]